MNRLSRSICHSVVEPLENRALLSTTLTVPATSDPYLLTRIAQAGPGTVAPSISLPAGSNRTLTFPNVIGSVADIPADKPFGADGFLNKPGYHTDIPSEGGISGLLNTNRFFYMVGLFTGTTIPIGNLPPRQDSTNIIGNASFAPLLDQVFFIGDGKTGTGSGAVQQFKIPDGAKQFYLGFGDNRTLTAAPGYYQDNVGVLYVTLNVDASKTGSINGTIYNDITGNGKVDGSDAGLSGVTVFLDANKNGKLDANETSAKTNAAGGYSFPGLTPGVFSVREILPAGFRATTPVSVSATVTAGVTAAVNFGDSQTAVISGTVFNDANGNQIKDPGETGLAGVAVYLDLDNNGMLDFFDVQTTTDANGNYSFTAPLGTYTIREVAPSNETLTTPVTPLTVGPAVLSMGNNIGDKHI